jgi:CheY-like chemotaxis protein
MPKVLVVDDSPMDRVLLEGVLKKDARMRISSVGSGAEALAVLADTQPDVVVTDLQMPELDGLQLVTAMRIHYPRIPVVLVTAHGSEDLAVRALEQGAASYVPKLQIATKLLETVDQVLSLAQADRSYESLAQCMDYAEFRFTMASDMATADRLVELVQQIVTSMGLSDVGGQVRLGMALEEALRSAILRGNLQLTSEQVMEASSRSSQQPQWLRDRLQASPFNNRKLKVHAQLSPTEASISITHEGDPWPTTQPHLPAENPGLEDPDDRSLILMRAFMDSVQFSSDGRTVTMLKRRG